MVRRFTHLFLPALTAIALIGCGDEAGVPRESSDALEGESVTLVNGDDPAESLTIRTHPDSGLEVVDGAGAVVFRNTDGTMAGVDVRAGYSITTDNGNPATATPTIIVAAANRTSKTIPVYALNPDTGNLRDIMVEVIPSGFDDPGSLCLYRSAVNGKLYVFALDGDDDGTVGQWQLYDNGLGQLRYTVQRLWTVGAPLKSCVTDEAEGVVYIAERAGTVWRYGAEPKDSFEERTAVDAAALGHMRGPGAEPKPEALE